MAPIKDYTIWPPLNASGDDLATPPLVWWTYQRPTKDLAEFLQAAVGTFDGTVAWQVWTTGARWILMPARIKEYVDSRGCNGDLIAAAELKVTEPDFGKRANDDLRSLAEHIRHCLQHVK